SPHHTATTELYTLSLHDALPISATSEQSGGLFRKRSSPAEAGRKRSGRRSAAKARLLRARQSKRPPGLGGRSETGSSGWTRTSKDRKSTRLNSSHVKISYAVFCL